MQAEVPDTSRVFVDVGLGFKVECSIEDGLRISGLRQAAAQVSSSWSPCKMLQILGYLDVLPVFMLVHATLENLHSVFFTVFALHAAGADECMRNGSSED